MDNKMLGEMLEDTFEMNKKKPGIFVLASGLATSALSLIIVFLIGRSLDFHIMCYYLNYVIPIGAVGVGLVAGSGYGIASYVSGVKISRKMLWAVIGLQLLTYFVAQYVEFLAIAPCYDDGTPLGFFEFYDLVARSFSWTQKDGSPGNPIGIWGYVFRLLEAAGFSLGGLFVTAMLFNQPYCPECQIYMNSRFLCLIPAGVKPRKISKKNPDEQAAFIAENEQAGQRAEELLAELESFSQNGQIDEFNDLVETLRKQKKEANAAVSRISLSLVFCKRCHMSSMTPVKLTGKGEQAVKTPMEPIPLDSDFVRRLTM